MPPRLRTLPERHGGRVVLGLLIAILALGLGFAIAAQVRQTSIEGLEDLREDELIRILDTVDQDGNRLAEEIQTLRLSRDRLQSDTTSLTEAREAAQQVLGDGPAREHRRDRVRGRGLGGCGRGSGHGRGR